jgi:hypothetical protein
MRRCYELAHIVAVSKTAYVPATPGCLDWRRDLQRASTDNSPPHPIDHPRRLRRYGMSQTLQHHHGRTTPYGRRRALLVAVLALLGATAFAAPRHLLNAYTDPSGYDDGTVSTALDQLRLAQVVAKDETLAAMMATRSSWLPVAGEVTNTNALLGHDGFVGMKTGSDQAASGCLMFRAVWPTESGSRSVIGVVLGQRGGNLLTAALYAAKHLVDRLAPNAGAGTCSSAGSAGRPSPGQPGLGTPPSAYRRHIENHIRAGNTQLS